MPADQPGESRQRGTEARFVETRWTDVLRAAHSTSPLAAESLERLCQTYWYPLYAFVRRSGRAPAEAEDLTQSFFAQLIEKRPLKSLARERGKFRTFLLACLRNFLNNQHDYERAARRDKARLVWWDALAPEERYQLEPADQAPELLFDKGWAASLVQRVLGELRDDYIQRDKRGVFAALESYLTTDVPDGVLSSLASRMSMSLGTLKSDLHRVRRDFANRLRHAVRDTLDQPTEQEIREEIRYLFATVTA